MMGLCCKINGEKTKSIQIDMVIDSVRKVYSQMMLMDIYSISLMEGIILLMIHLKLSKKIQKWICNSEAFLSTLEITIIL